PRPRPDAERLGESRRCDRGDESRDRGFAQTAGFVLAGWGPAESQRARRGSTRAAFEGRRSDAARAADSGDARGPARTGGANRRSATAGGHGAEPVVLACLG